MLSIVILEVYCETTKRYILVLSVLYLAGPTLGHRRSALWEVC